MTIISVFFVALSLFGPRVVSAAERSLTLPNATRGSLYSYSFTADSGYAEPYRWDVFVSTSTGTGLPSGLSLVPYGSRSALLNGTPAIAGVYQFIVAPFSRDGTSLPDTLVTLRVLAQGGGLLIEPGPGSLVGTVGVPFSSLPVFTVSGGVAPYTWSRISGGLPSGLAFTSGGMIEGTPTEAGRYILHAQVEDANGFRASTSIEVVTSRSSVPVTVTSTPSVVSARFLSTPTTLDLAGRRNLLGTLGIQLGTLVQSSVLDPVTFRYPVYYIGDDGRRHPFQSDTVYGSWYPATPGMRTVNAVDIGSIPFGDAVIYHPGERVRFRTDNRVYALIGGKSIQSVSSPDASGWVWTRPIQDLGEVYFDGYDLVTGFATPSTLNPTSVRSSHQTPASVLPAG